MKNIVEKERDRRVTLYKNTTLPDDLNLIPVMDVTYFFFFFFARFDIKKMYNVCYTIPIHPFEIYLSTYRIEEYFRL